MQHQQQRGQRKKQQRAAEAMQDRDNAWKRQFDQVEREMFWASFYHFAYVMDGVPRMCNLTPHFPTVESLDPGFSISKFNALPLLPQENDAG
jgi:hypothetical protein